MFVTLVLRRHLVGLEAHVVVVGHVDGVTAIIKVILLTYPVDPYHKVAPLRVEPEFGDGVMARIVEGLSTQALVIVS